MKKNRIGIILVCFGAFLSSCSNSNIAPEIPTTYPIDNNSSISEDMSTLYDSHYPVQEITEGINLPEKITISEPTLGHATVYGKLVSVSQNNSAYIAPSLFLGDLISSTDSENGLIVGSISIESDPIAQQALNGDFIFVDIAPGNYGLFIWTPASAFIIHDTQTNQPITFIANADEMINLGVIYVP